MNRYYFALYLLIGSFSQATICMQQEIKPPAPSETKQPKFTLKEELQQSEQISSQKSSDSMPYWDAKKIYRLEEYVNCWGDFLDRFSCVECSDKFLEDCRDPSLYKMLSQCFCCFK
jgi:hypothetical protein